MKVKRRCEIDTEKFRVGDRIKIKLKTGEKHTATAIRMEKDGMLFIFDQFLDEPAQMNKESSVAGEYEGSDMRKHLKTVSETLPRKILKRIVPFENGDYLRLLTITEICGVDDDFNKCKGQIPYFKDRRHRIASKKNDECEWMWTSTVVSSDYFAYVNAVGHKYSDYANKLFGVRPAFKIRNQ